VRGCQALLQPALAALSEPEDQDLAVFLLESHGYFAIMAMLCGEEDTDIGAMAFDFYRRTLPRIRRFPAFGSMFAYEPETIVYIPQLLQTEHKAHSERLSLAERTGRLAMRPHVPRPGPAPLIDGTDVDDVSSKQKAAIVSFKAAVLNLHADSLLDPILTAISLEPQVVKAMEHLRLLQQATETCYGLVPYLILLGSYLREPHAQRTLHSYLQSFTSEMPLQQRATELLEWHWAEADTVLIGPQAIRRTAVAHGVSAYLC
jgi:hypothetical protein